LQTHLHCSLFEILQTIYFACFGLISVDTFAIDQPHYVTQFIGKLMFGCYLACNMLVLINMLIAMLTESLRIISVRHSCAF
jgi:transient receptor potential cation channel subfamily C protein 4